MVTITNYNQNFLSVARYNLEKHIFSVACYKLEKHFFIPLSTLVTKY